ncbi:MAG: TonB-dependent receptor [Coleofasciculus sp. C2-GNP5-27]
MVENTGFRNIAATNTSGLDIAIGYSQETSIGDFAVGLRGTYLIKNDFQATPEAEVFSILDTVNRPIDLVLRGTLSWSKRGFTIFTAVNYDDSYTDNLYGGQFSADGKPIPVQVDAWTTVDFSLRYDSGATFARGFLQDTTLSASVINIFDSDPPEIGEANQFVRYDTGNATALGRYIRLQISKRF